MKIYDSFADVKSGDTLFFSNNTATGFILKTGTSSLWNHVGIAIRIINDNEISTTKEGKLYVFDINSGTRYDPIFKKEISGASYVDIEVMMKKYNIISYRSIIDEFRKSTSFSKKVKDFIKQNLGCKFTTGLHAFVSAWWNIDCLFQSRNNPDGSPNVIDKSETNGSKFCTQLVIDFYTSVFNKKLDELFTSDCPSESRLYSPELMSKVTCPCYSNNIEKVYESYCDLFTVILLPILFVLLFIVLLWYFLP